MALPAFVKARTKINNPNKIKATTTAPIVVTKKLLSRLAPSELTLVSSRSF